MKDWQHLRPTPEQYRNFGDYLCGAHSWYKHLPLMGGRRFVVFVSPDAGLGRLVGGMRGGVLCLETPPEPLEFTDAHPRIHYGWRTTKEYRARFGYLDYSYHVEAGAYTRDVGPPINLPAHLVQRCEFVLYPYVSPLFANAIAWGFHGEGLKELRSGAAHPTREEVLELAQLAETLGSAKMAQCEQEQRLGYGEGEEPLPAEPPEELRQRQALGRRLLAIMESLRNREARKIHRALEALDEWLMQESS